MTKLSIIGAGIAGLTAANVLWRHNPAIYELQPALPNNHNAVLRFRTSSVGDALGIPFKKVQMIKTYQPHLNPIADALNYSFKNTGQRRSDRSIIAGTVSAERWIAPPNFIERIADPLTIRYNKDISHIALNQGPIISTMPMPALMSFLEYPAELPFHYRPQQVIRAFLKDTDAYVSLLVPDPGREISRISITGNEIIIECPNALDFSPVLMLTVVDTAFAIMGLQRRDLATVPTTHQSTYAKILPIDEDVRKTFIAWATATHNVYSLGRFATWRPALLADDLLNDIRWIERHAF